MSSDYESQCLHQVWAYSYSKLVLTGSQSRSVAVIRSVQEANLFSTRKFRWFYLHKAHELRVFFVFGDFLLVHSLAGSAGGLLEVALDLHLGVTSGGTHGGLGTASGFIDGTLDTLRSLVLLHLGVLGSSTGFSLSLLGVAY